jgi:oligopeptide transport system substrate-binding protein
VRPRSGRKSVIALVVGLALVAGACSSSKSSKSSTDTGKGSNVANELSSSSCGTLKYDKSAPSGGTFVDYAWLSDSGTNVSFDPGVVQSLSESQITYALFDSLTDFDFTEKCSPVLKPSVAEKFTSNPTATEFTFTIRKGEKFSNGEPVLPSNFKIAWERAGSKALASPYGYLINNIKGGADLQAGKISTLDAVVADDSALTLKVTLAQANADFPAIVSHAFWSPITKAEATKFATTAGWGNQGVTIGNGPFKIDGNPTTQEVDLVPNPNWAGNVYGDTKPKLARLVFKASDSVTAAYQTFQSGQGNDAPIPPGQIKAAEAQYPNNTVKDPNLGSYYFDIGDVPQLSGPVNLPLRKAISLAIDRDEINNKVYEGARTISTGITPPGIPGFKSNLCDYCKTDIAKAKQFYADWQKGGGTLSAPIKIEYNPGGGHETVATIIQADLKQNLGLETTLDPIASHYFREIPKPNACNLCRSGWYADYPTYGNFMVDLFSKSSLDGNNFGRFQNDKFETLIKQAQGETDAAKRASYYQDAEKVLLNEQVNAIPLNWYTGQNVFGNNVVNYDQPPLGTMLWERLAVKG